MRSPLRAVHPAVNVLGGLRRTLIMLSGVGGVEGMDMMDCRRAISSDVSSSAGELRRVVSALSIMDVMQRVSLLDEDPGSSRGLTPGSVWVNVSCVVELPVRVNVPGSPVTSGCSWGDTSTSTERTLDSHSASGVRE